MRLEQTLAAVAAVILVFDCADAHAAGNLDAFPSVVGSPVTQRYYAYKIDPVGIGRSVPAAINDSGMIVGTLLTDTGYVPFLTGARGAGAKRIEFSDSSQGVALAVNNAGMVVGSYLDPKTLFYSPYVYTQERGATPIFDRSPPEGGSATAVNNNNQIVGYILEYYAPFEDYFYHGFMVKPSGEIITRFPQIPADSFRPTAINDSGQVTGATGNAIGPIVTGPMGRGFVAFAPDAVYGESNAINSRGNVAGEAFGSFASGHVAFSTLKGTDKFNLHRANGVSDSRALAIAPNGTTGGWSQVLEAPFYRAFIAKPKGALQDLNPLIVNKPPGVTFTAVYGINSSLQAAVEADDGNAYIVCPAENCR